MDQVLQSLTILKYSLKEALKEPFPLLKYRGAI